MDDVRLAIVPCRDVDEGHGDRTVGVLDGVGDDARLWPELDADLPALDRHAVTDDLGDGERLLVTVDVPVVGQGVDEDGRLAVLGDAGVVDRDRRVVEVLLAAHRQRGA